MSRKKYLNAAEKQKAYRLRHGQKRKVPLAIRRGEKLGAQETDLRAKKENETWQGYQDYIEKAVSKARKRQEGAATTPDTETKPGASRGGIEPVTSEDYYELRRQYEKDLEELAKRGRKYKRK